MLNESDNRIDIGFAGGDGAMCRACAGGDGFELDGAGEDGDIVSQWGGVGAAGADVGKRGQAAAAL